MMREDRISCFVIVLSFAIVAVALGELVWVLMSPLIEVGS